jgi:shikimate kinase
MSSVSSLQIILIGYRAVGKSVVGKLLAQQLALPYVELDALIVERAETSIVELVAEKGWDHFRNLESDLLRETLSHSSQVIDTGGGVIEREENRALIKEGGFVVWLKAPIETLRKRLSHSTHRPALTAHSTTRDEIASVLTRREPHYRTLAQLEIDTATLTPEMVARTIADHLNERGIVALPNSTRTTPPHTTLNQKEK